MEEKTDEELVRLTQEGNISAFTIILKRYEGKILRYGKRFLFSHENIEDAVQTIFIKAYQNINSFNVNKKFSPWIYRIAHNHFINIIKRTKREPFLFFDADVIFSFSNKKSILSEIEKTEEKKEIEKCLEKINIKYREPIILYYFEDKSYKDISDILKIPISTVGVRLKRGLVQIKKYYEKRK